MSNQTLPKYDLQKLADSMITFFDESTDQILHLLRIMNLLLEGHPLSPERIAAELQLSQDEVSNILRVAELDQEGHLVGWGLSLVPTPHSCQVNGRQFYVWCAADAIMSSIFLKADAVIESPDPISGDMVRLIATPEGPRDIEPSTAVISHASTIESFETVRTQSCNVTHFFTSVETASQYVSQHPGLPIVPVGEAFQLWQRVWGREPYKSVIAEY